MSNDRDGYEEHRLEEEAFPERRPMVGRMLREVRESYELDVRDVAAALRLRPFYVQAIEEGRYDDLPGETYAIGFVRTYADYLRLDSEEAVRRFKAEFSGPEPRSLRFPTPPQEGRIPGGVLILAALVLVVLGYGAWLYFGQEERSFTEVVEAVPEDLKPLIDEVQPPFQSSSPPQPQPEPLSEPSTAQDATAPETEAFPDPALPGAAMGPMPESSAAESSATESSATESSAIGPEAPQPLAAESGESVASATAETQAPPPPIPERSTGAEAQEGEGRTYGAVNGEARVVILADSEAWVQIREADGSLQMTRVLQPGDRYRVPDRPGLLLDVGNAGGITILLDGESLPALGDLGQVRRGLSLDPEALREGRGQ